ncbi:MAG TPA: shikimate dehydrogenase [Pseudothauera hydrothermalis]|nr:shikimate dehydrogenase [Rhodocyclaceae bacterium]HNQ76513.1 shikimate dehydrogenase [Pseudothauera hydrothermalis]
MDRYAVVGNPVAHSKSPLIHAAFAAQTGQTLVYEALLAPLDGFAATVETFRAAGGRGLNVTVPFKLDAFTLAERLSPRAEAAGAVNTLAFDRGDIYGDNTDGCGLVRDLTQNLGWSLSGRRILLLGAGGAARGALLPLLMEQPAALVIANRTESRAVELADRFRAQVKDTLLHACSFDALSGSFFDVVINATAASLAAQSPALPEGLYAPGALAYDMMYGKDETPFMRAARSAGAAVVADGLGMLVEQAAESFFLWRGVRPHTRAVLATLRTLIGQG